MKLKVYISGPITDNPDFKKQFAEASAYVEKYGYEAVNPANNEIPDGNWQDYMKMDLHQLIDCNAIYMLKGWSKSKGAKLEHRIAKELNMLISYQDKEEKEDA